MDLLFVLIVLAVAAAVWFVTKKITERKLNSIIGGLRIELSDEQFTARRLRIKEEELRAELSDGENSLSLSMSNISKWKHLYEKERDTLRDLRLSTKDAKPPEKTAEKPKPTVSTTKKDSPNKRLVSKRRSPRGSSKK